MTKQVVLAGRNVAVLDLARRLRRDPASGRSMIGACIPLSADRRQLESHGIAVLGHLDQVVRVVDAVGTDAVVVASGSGSAAQYLRQLAWRLEGTNIDVPVGPGLVEVAPEPAADPPHDQRAADPDPRAGAPGPPAADQGSAQPGRCCRLARAGRAAFPRDPRDESRSGAGTDTVASASVGDLSNCSSSAAWSSGPIGRSTRCGAGTRERGPVQAAPGSASHPRGPVPPEVLTRRAAAADQRPQG
jgi:hypothetical protein